jgi:penicillin-binding protein 1C
LAFGLALLLARTAPLPEEKPWSRVVLARDSTLLASYLSEDDKWRMKVHLDETSPDVVTAVMAKEDRWFFLHPGVNPVSIARALWNNTVQGRRTSGASTLTMQLARMMEPKQRTYSNKAAEILRAFALEMRHSKAELLEMYLSYLPYGGNVEGIKAASYLYFDKPPSSLSLSQAVLLTVIPNRPNSLRLDHGTGPAVEMRDKWLHRFQDEGVFPAPDIAVALSEPVESRRYQMRIRAPHFSHFISQRYPQDRIVTTLDPDAQMIAENLLAAYVRRVRALGVSNGAVLVVDNATHSVVAYCGSADFRDRDAHGQVNGVRAVRSPGSTLKPGLFALAFDQGILTPKSRMLDVSTNYAGYVPENFDLTFHGPVTAEYALRNSLNIPAVTLLRDVGARNYIQALGAAGFSTISQQREGLGLSLVLGGCGATLEELTRAYSSFPNHGMLYPLAYTPDEAADPMDSVRLYSTEASYMVWDILSGVQRADAPLDLVSHDGHSTIAWKTGTSWGRRDAWSIGFDGRYTIGVWIGNFSGQGAPELSGATMAVPLLFDLFNGLEKGKARIPMARPKGLAQRTVCAETGDLPSANCAHTTADWYIPAHSHRRVCAQEQLLYISEDSSIQYCTGCLPPTGYLRTSYSVYPSELILWMNQNNTPFRQPPPHNPNCEAVFHGAGPTIVSPAVDFEYLLERGAGQEMSLQATSQTDVNLHYWYVDGKYVGSCKPGEKVFFSPKAGKRRFTCRDDRGRSSSVEIVVKMY